jgi:hypothetical protein
LNHTFSYGEHGDGGTGKRVAVRVKAILTGERASLEEHDGA